MKLVPLLIVAALSAATPAHAFNCALVCWARENMSKAQIDSLAQQFATPEDIQQGLACPCRVMPPATTQSQPRKQPRWDQQ